MKHINIMKHVSILDQIRIHILQPTPGNVEVHFECLDNTKNVIIDQKALKEMNHQITERTKDMSANDPKTLKYIEEFVAKLLEALWQNGLVELIEPNENPSDPYEDLRKQYSTN
jgi:hypothetical protein